MNVDDALAKVHLAPDDDAAKLVAADVLLEAKDPRGEFIALQFKDWRGEAEKEDRTRVAALLSKHWDRWLGPLAEVVEPDSVVFEKGFLRECRLVEGACAPSVIETWNKAPALREMRELGVPDLDAAELIRLLERPSLQHLLGPRLLSGRALQALATRETPWPFTSFGVRGTAKALVSSAVILATGQAFVRLKRLSLSLERFGRSAVAELLKGLTKYQLHERFDALHVETMNNDSGALGYTLTALSRFAPHAVVSVEHPHLSGRLVPGDAGPEVVIRGGAIASHVFDFVRAFDVPRASFTLHQSGGALPGESELDALRNDLRRLKPRRAVFPAAWGVVDV
ncbi:MAG: hypothetical protein Q8L14_39390 [Myxococcales bacterium]|nr:hypothetical protein [Myxococcales bacterium]